jgi:hypothetical protein
MSEIENVTASGAAAEATGRQRQRTEIFDESLIESHTGSPAVLFRCLETLTQQSCLSIAAKSLTRVQATVCQNCYDRATLTGVLQFVEQMMCDLSPSGFSDCAHHEASSVMERTLCFIFTGNT